MNIMVLAQLGWPYVVGALVLVLILVFLRGYFKYYAQQGVTWAAAVEFAIADMIAWLLPSTAGKLRHDAQARSLPPAP